MKSRIIWWPELIAYSRLSDNPVVGKSHHFGVHICYNGTSALVGTYSVTGRRHYYCFRHDLP